MGCAPSSLPSCPKPTTSRCLLCRELLWPEAEKATGRIFRAGPGGCRPVHEPRSVAQAGHQPFAPLLGASASDGR
jgi:hypothetical protein